MIPLAIRQSLVMLLTLSVSFSSFAESRFQSGDEAAIRALIERYLAAKTDEERQRLLTGERESLSVETRKALIRQGTQLSSKGDFSQALSLFQLAHKVAEQIGDKEGIAAALRVMAVIHTRRGDYALALEYCQKSLEMFEALSDKAGIAGVLNNIGIIHQSQDNYALAMEYHQKSLAIREALGDKAAISGSLNNIGNVHRSQGNYAEALDYYQKGLAMKEALGDKPGIAISLNNIGLIHQSQGNYALAMEHFQKGLMIEEALGNKVGIAGALHNIGLVYGSQDNDAEALAYYRKGLAIRESLGDKPGIALALTNIGLVHHAQGNYALAMEHFQKALALREALGEKAGIAYNLGFIGVIHEAQGNYAQAMEHFQKSLAIREALGDKARTAFTLIYIGELFEKQGLYTQALDYASRAAAIAKQSGSLDYLWHSQLIAGRAYISLNQPEPARQAFMDSINTIETMRAQAAGTEQDAQRFFEGMISPYYSMIDLLAARGSAAEALAFAERAKARVLLDVLRSGRVNVTKAMTREEKEQERKLKGALVSLNSRISGESRRAQPDRARLAQLQAQLEQARLDHEDFQTRLYAAHPDLRAQRGEAPEFKPVEAAALLADSNTALVEYAVTDDATYLFALSKPAAKASVDLKVYKIPVKRKELSSLVKNFRRTLAARDPEFRKPALQLYDLLLKPAAAQLQGKTSIVIVPDDRLWELPFQALMPSASRHLIEESAISYAPSLTVLREMIAARGKRKASGSTAELLALGNPALGNQTVERVKLALRDEKLDPLPQAEREVKTLAELYGAAQSKVYVGAEAREETAKSEASRFRVLHFATHGILNDASPMYSNLVLTQGEAAEDGLLEAWELMNMDLRADLVVLSACETARGRVGAGEGVIGLSWALFVAGTPTTVVSQWKVASGSTAQLMLEFHKNLKPAAGRTTKAGAMRAAAMKLMKTSEYRHPFHWAGFIVVGSHL
ncbi:MAG TPA: tetratricopeptide repeat protein [Blastocatellia bacterium]|nr:tetratricopeptide repeat protein [Blastocatellia bacterium]